MSQTTGIVQPTEWKERFDRLTAEHVGDEVTIEVLSNEFGDDYEAEWLPFSYLDYDPKDDVFIVAVGGRDSRYPVVLHHFVAHPRSTIIDSAGLEVPLAVEVVGSDESRTVVSVRPSSAAGDAR